MSSRNQLLESIADTIADYRAGEIAAPTPQHVDKWIKQFAKGARDPMLAELDHVLKETYQPRTEVRKFLGSLLKTQKFAGDDPCSFWKNVQFFDIQRGGNSQHEMLEMVDALLQKRCGFGIDDCGEKPKAFLYLDDAIFTGNRLLNDMRSWIRADAPKKSAVHVATIALHCGGQWYAEKEITKAAGDAEKTIQLTWWRCLEIEDRKSHVDTSDVLRPTVLPDDDLVTVYVKGLRYAPVLRTPGNVGGNEFFSCEEGRHLLEQEFLKAGVRIRSLCPHLNKYQRPLGNMVLDTLGFGSLLVTFRNCPNNCPLALWAGDPWYPLFPRKTN